MIYRLKLDHVSRDGKFVHFYNNHQQVGLVIPKAELNPAMLAALVQNNLTVEVTVLAVTEE